MPDSVNYNELARSLQWGFNEDNYNLNGFTPLDLKGRQEGILVLKRETSPLDTIRHATADRDALLQEAFGLNPTYTFYIPRDFLVDLLYNKPNVHGLQFVFGSEYVNQITRMLDPRTGKPRTLGVNRHNLLFTAAHFTTAVHYDHNAWLDPEDIKAHHWLIPPFYSIAPGTAELSVVSDGRVNTLASGFKAYKQNNTTLATDSPNSYFVGRQLLIKNLLNIGSESPITTDSILRGYAFLRIELLLHGAYKGEALVPGQRGSQCVGLIMRGVNTKTTGLFTLENTLSAGTTFCTSEYSGLITGQHCTLPCPSYCPAGIN